ncbi:MULTISPECIES: PhzF family phenazine biosynthesis protein [unclassified Paraburkholderia]|uniref:PhzF family phenazine biosynthesis protein n=1 Tax=unclassified Paraburkholderia TaxID=2615204 RepID=UPI002AAF2367|nr:MULTISPECIES: PhzF family phenazine biosynthesis protein [unclassified Paraburkholderia]
MTLRTHSMLCFGRHEASGNPALVVEDFSSNENDRLAFARQSNAAASVFVDHTSDASLVLDFYYPHARSPLCLHATLAAGALLFSQRPDATRLHAVTSMRGQSLQIEKRGELIFVELQAQACPPVIAGLEETARLLGENVSYLMGTPGLASVGSAKLLVEVQDETALRGLTPDLAGIAAWSRAHGVSGIYAYCALGNDTYAGRNFNHLDPSLEDAATGVAAGALAVRLERDITLLQGDGRGQPCTIVATYRSGTVQVGGRVVAHSD